MTDPESHTLRLLQELRGEMQDMRQDIRDLRQETRDGFDDVNTRLDGVTHILTLLAANLHDHEGRLDRLERADDGT